MVVLKHTSKRQELAGTNTLAPDEGFKLSCFSRAGHAAHAHHTRKAGRAASEASDSEGDGDDMHAAGSSSDDEYHDIGAPGACTPDITGYR
eukprot:scaffold68971_cov21-Tisochrysis_lutea.AAC.1